MSTKANSMPWRRTMVMGHEGAGIVRQCGPGVERVNPGDRVLLNWAIPCAECFPCRLGAENICEQKPTVPDQRFQHRESFINASFHLGTRATHAVAPGSGGAGLSVIQGALHLGCWLPRAR